MKKVLVLLLLGLVSICCSAQSAPQNIYAAGVSYNQGSSPAVAGTGLWAHSIDDKGTFAFTVIDILPLGYHPFLVTTNVSTGVAQKVATFKGIDLYASGSAGLSVNGQNTGWAWTGGVLADVSIKGKHFMPNVRVLKSSVGNGAGYQPIIGVLYRF